jgi:hypothetical protein
MIKAFHPFFRVTYQVGCTYSRCTANHDCPDGDEKLKEVQDPFRLNDIIKENSNADGDGKRKKDESYAVPRGETWDEFRIL